MNDSTTHPNITSGWRKRAPMAAASLAAAGVLLMTQSAFAQGAPGATGGNPLGLVVVLAGLALLPFLLIMVTSFVKVAVVLSLLRTAIGAQQVPPNQVITGLAIVLSVYIMAPVAMDTYQVVEPVVQKIEQTEERPEYEEWVGTAKEAVKPLKGFLLKHADPAERVLLHELAIQLRTPEQQKSLEADDLIIAIPAFVLTELKEAFTIGFLLFVPFLIVDLVVANILLSLGMHMLSPTTVSLPFKLLLFVLVDGWYLVVKGLILGYV
ncbi:MAG: type III secretion system export apparatus subunit SctR [Myxococcota bacterium]|nr:type III secretion system export apparatus subunit SctR [Myxococcota bacterium]